MHIPDSMLNGHICPVTAAASITGIAAATFFAVKSTKKPSLLKFAAITALIFAAQMMNFPVQNGTSGHLLGSTLAILMLGIPYGMLAITSVLTVQCLVFADGGLTVLGANILNMAIIGAIPGAILYPLIQKQESKLIKALLIIIGSWISVVLASTACSIELGISETVATSTALKAMVGIHSLIGIGEAVITTTAVMLLNIESVKKTEKLNIGIPVISAAIIGLLLSPLASSYPDGLEWVAEKYSFLHESAPLFVSPMPDYSMPFISNEILSGSIAGLAGVCLTFLFALILGSLTKLRTNRA